MKTSEIFSESLRESMVSQCQRGMFVRHFCADLSYGSLANAEYHTRHRPGRRLKQSYIRSPESMRSRFTRYTRLWHDATVDTLTGLKGHEPDFVHDYVTPHSMLLPSMIHFDGEWGVDLQFDDSAMAMLEGSSEGSFCHFSLILDPASQQR